MTDYAKTVMRQYANSPAITALLVSFDEWLSPERFVEDFLHDIWDISTASGFGLDVWGRILGQSRFLAITPSPNDNFGFDTEGAPGTNWNPFNVAPFYSAGTGTTSFALQDDAYRQLLLVKAAANIASCNPAALNALLRALFSTRGQSYVRYNIDVPMVMDYVFDFFPSPVERAIIESGLFPVPAGVLVNIVFKQFDFAPFGFSEMNSGADPAYVTGFNQGPFYSASN